MVDNDITAITVSWNTQDLVKTSYGSIRQFHPDMKIIIVDGSDSNNQCRFYIEDLVNRDKNVEALLFSNNIGHGRGMDQGIKKVKTPYTLFFDSDIIMVKSPLEQMLQKMKQDTFGVGYIEKVGFDGHDYGVFAHHFKEPGIKYLHPYFQLIQTKQYFNYFPYIHHGAPCIGTMIDIYRKGLSDQVLIDFPGLGHTNGCGCSWKPCPGEYIIHDVAGFGGTGKMRVASGLPHIEGSWDLSYRGLL